MGRKRQTFASDSDDPIVAEINRSKVTKTRCKAMFTRRRHELLDLLLETDIDSSCVKEVKNKLINAYEDALNILTHLSELYEKSGDLVNIDKTSKEIDKLEEEFEKAESRFETFTDTLSVSDHSEGHRPGHQLNTPQPEEHFDSKPPSSTSPPQASSYELTQTPNGAAKLEEEDDPQIGRDMWKQLTRVSIPTFSGDKRTFGSW